MASAITFSTNLVASFDEPALVFPPKVYTQPAMFENLW